jgi:Domain of unknown function (DUF4365)
MGKADHIGVRGESIEISKLAMFCRTKPHMPYFEAHFLGEKCRRYDYLVELVDAGERPQFFFVQVKATQKELTKRQDPPRLRVEVSKDDVRQMVACPIPTYLVGVHEPTERAFVIAIHGAMSEAISSITTAHELNPLTLRKLWEEVKEFWLDHDMARTSSCLLN